uniref:Neurogenic locus notch homolog protein 1-like n=1 Tax=Hirondellea gigas TaxID=1518452 RepID=A0A2P2I579_9CRUS
MARSIYLIFLLRLHWIVGQGIPPTPAVFQEKAKETNVRFCGTSTLPGLQNGYYGQWRDNAMYVHCDAGLAMPSGESHVQLSCSEKDGWSHSESQLICNVQCNTTSSACTLPANYCDPTLYPGYTISFGKVTKCPESYTLVSPTPALTCSHGAWSPEESCTPVCEDGCGGYGTCVAPGQCICHNLELKQTCTVQDDDPEHNKLLAECGPHPPTAIHHNMSKKAQIHCPAGFQFEHKSIGDSATLECVDGRWTTSVADISCVPSCAFDFECLNGGHCGKNGKCVCPSDFFGSLCERKRCLPLPEISNADVIRSTERSSAAVVCRASYEFNNDVDSPFTKARVFCYDGEWLLPPVLQSGCVLSPFAECPQIQLPDFVTEITRSDRELLLSCYVGEEFVGAEIRAECTSGDWVCTTSNHSLKTLTISQWHKLCQPAEACSSRPGLKQHMNFTVAETSQLPESDSHIGFLRCDPGYQFPSGSLSMFLSCSLATKFLWAGPALPSTLPKRDAHLNQLLGDLDPSVPQCLAVCEPPCLNGGTCSSPGRCLCPSSHTGLLCDQPCDHITDANACTLAPPAIAHANLYYNGSVAMVECQPGYELHTGLTHFHITCRHDTWTPDNAHGGIHREELPRCDPVCQFPCLNGGRCHKPNSCSCPPQFRGPYCQVSKQPKCPDAPQPVPNAQIYITAGGRVLKCAKGYKLPGKLKKALIWCSAGKWVYPTVLTHQRQQNNSTQRAPYNRMLRESFFPCSPVCEPPCLNGGVCVSPQQCQCPHPFTGHRCKLAKPDLCWSTPPVMQNASIMFSARIASLVCGAGYVLPSGGSSVDLVCRAGVWQANFNSITASNPSTSLMEGCRPVCSSPCLNGGSCVAPDICRCADGFTGASCKTVAPKPCNVMLTAKLHANLNFSSDSNTVVMACHEGYGVTPSIIRTTLRCVNGSWTGNVLGKSVLGEAVECRPLCRGGCSNGGVCSAPGVCRCSQGFAGHNCNTKTCGQLPQLLNNTVLNYDSTNTVLELQCGEGYRLPSGNLTATLYCDDGTWTSLHGEQQVVCLPSCHPPCLNGGRCTAPNTCNCPSGFDGATCGKRYSLTVGGTRCVFPFYHRGRLHHACTSSYNYSYHPPPPGDNPQQTSLFTTTAPSAASTASEQQEGVPSTTEPWCPTTVDSYRRPVQWEVCAARLGPVSAVVTKGGQRCVFPFTYKGHEYNSCFSTGGRSAARCATEVTTDGEAIARDFCDLQYGLESVALTFQNRECHFPFRYEGKWYDECLARFNHAGSWCATDVSPSGDLLTKGNCIVHWGHQQDQLTETRQVCASPYKVNGVEYTNCQGRPPWCAVKLRPDRELEKFAVCDPVADWPGRSVSLPSVVEKPEVQVYTVSGERCLPRGEVGLEGCVADGSVRGLPWCPLSRDRHGVVTRKGVCLPDWNLSFVPPWHRSFINAGPKQPLVRQTVKSTRCVLPFRYRGRTYLDCAPHLQQDGDAASWCAVSVTATLEVQRWGICKNNAQSRPYSGPKILSVVGNTVTQQQRLCVLPFKHQGSVYYTCVPHNYTRDTSSGWCATAVSGDGEMIKRGDCPKLATTHTVDILDAAKQCKDDAVALAGGASGSLPGIERSSLSLPSGKADGHRCVVSFVHHNVTYLDCTDAEADEIWCAVQVDDQRLVVKKDRCTPGLYRKPNDALKEVAWDKNWLLDMRGAVLREGQLSSALQHVNTVTGKSCVLPFKFSKSSTQHYNCVCPAEGCLNGRPICATGVDSNGIMTASEPCKGLLIRPDNFADLISH